MLSNKKVYGAPRWLSRRHLLMATTALWLAAADGALANDIEPANSATMKYLAPNGVPVVNIATPNGKGLSHNKYNKFSVQSNGAVLNNTDKILQSKLAGAIRGNPNIKPDKEAAIILNEVIKANRSQLKGYIEVNGKKADVIIANPWGISANGLGFINAGRATLTTGTPEISGAGALNGFKVRRGDLVVEGAGINAEDVTYLDLVVRSARLGHLDTGEGNINATNLHMTTGSSNWNYETRESTVEASSEPAPQLAIDSRAFGGMYANRIQIVANDAGVGVRALGNMAASAEDLLITSAGTLELKGTMSAEKAVSVTYTGDNTGKISVDGADASITAKTDVTLTAGDGSIELVQASLKADNDLTLSGASLNDSGTGTQTRAASNDIKITTTGTVTVDNTKWIAGNDLTATTNGITVGANGAELYAGTDGAKAGKSISLTATTGDIDLKTAKLESANDITVTATAGAISTTAGGTQEIEATDAVNLNAATTLTNAGTVLAGGDLTVRNTNAGSDLGVTNSGRLQATGTLDVAGNAGDDKVTINNTATGKMLGGTLTVKAKSLTNANGAVAQGGAGSSVDVTNTLANAGALHATGDMTVNAGTLQNTNTAGLSSTGGLTITTTSDFTNEGALYSGTALSLTATGQTVTNALTGTMNSSGTMTLNAGTLTNYNDLRATGDVDITTTTAFNNLMTVQNGTMTDLIETYSGMTQAQMAGFDNQVAHNEVVFHDGTGSNRFRFNDVNYDNMGDRVQGSGAAVDENWSIYQYYGDYYEEGSCLNGCGVLLYRLAKGQTKTSEINRLSAGATVKKATIASGGTMTVNIGAGTGLNDGSVMTASTININGTGNFTNNARANELKTEYAVYGRIYHGHDEGGDRVKDRYNFRRLNAPGANWIDDVNWVNEGSETAARNHALANLHDAGSQQLGSVGAGIYATTLNINLGAGTFTNKGVTVDAKAGAAQAASVTTSGSSTAFTGLNVSLPTNPNGIFVTVTDPQARYLIESNPRFGLNADYLGSDYLLDQLDLDEETEDPIRRLGDAAYENHLIRQQIMGQTGREVLSKFRQNEALQTKALFDNAAQAATNMKLSVGVALSRDQIANLKTDIVWMVRQQVNGQEVLAPVVYLAEATLDGLQAGNANVVAENTNIQAGALTNTGGLIQGSNDLAITTTGDITNTAGTITGGNVQVASTSGSIINETLATDTGGHSGGTQLSRTASISATNDLTLNAGQDITNIGAQVSAGGDADLTAGNDVTFTNLQNTTRTFTKSSSQSGRTSTWEGSGSSTTTNVGSGLTVGGNLNLDAGNDLTVQGSDVNVTSGADIKTGGDVNLIAGVEGTTSTSQRFSETTSAGNFLASTGSSTSSTVTNSSTTTARASTLNIGGNLNADIGNDLTSVGSDINVGGNADLNTGGDINLLAAMESSSTETVRKSETKGPKIMGFGGGHSSESRSWNNSQTAAGSTLNVGGNLDASGRDIVVQASDVNVTGNADLDASRDIVVTTAEQISSEGRSSKSNTDLGLGSFAKVDLTSSNSTDRLTNARSGINVGGDLDASSGRDFIVKGSDVDVKGSGTIDAGRDKLVLAAQDRTLTKSERSQNFGIVGSIVGGLNKSKETTVDELRNQGTTETVAGNLNISAKRDVVLQGAQIEGKSDVTVDAGRNQLVMAAEDKTTTTTVETVDKGFSFFAEANSSADTSSTNGQAGANVQRAGFQGHSGSVGAGIQREMETTTTVRTQTTAVTSSITAGGDLSRSAGNLLADQGTQIEAGGNYDQTATTIRNVAAENTDTTTTTTENTRIRLGFFAEGSVEQNLSTNAQAIGDKVNSMKDKAGRVADGSNGAGDRAGAYVGARAQGATLAQDFANLAQSEGEAGGEAGIEARVTMTTTTTTTSNTEAVVSNIKVGGNFSSTSSGNSTFEGTNVDAGGNIDLQAAKLDVTAARDSQTETTDKTVNETYRRLGVSAGVEADMGKGKGDASAGAGVETGFRNSQEFDTQTDTQAVVANFTSGGSFKATTAGDANFEGTNIQAGTGAAIDAGGSVNFNAAEDTSSSNSTAKAAGGYFKVGVDATGAPEGGAGANMSDDKSSANSSTAVAGSIDAGKGGLSISAGNDVTLEGTDAKGQGALDVNAGGNVTFAAATDTSSSNSREIDARVDAEISADSGGVELAGAIKGETSSSTTQTGGSLNFGSGVNVDAGNDLTLVGTDVTSGSDVNLAAGGKVDVQATKSNESSVSGEVSAKLEIGKNTDFGFEGTGTISGSHTEEGATINAGGDLNISSGGETRLEGTQATVGGSANIDADGGVKSESTESYGGTVSGGLTSSGYNLAEADATLSIDQTSIQAGGAKKPEPPKAVKDTMLKVKELMKGGATRDEALQSLGVSGDTFKQWTKNYVDLTRDQK